MASASLSNESITNTVTPFFLYTKHNKYLNSCGNVRATRFIVKVNAKTINIIHGFCIWLYSITCSVKTIKFLPQAESVADITKNYQVKEPNFQIHLNQTKTTIFFYIALWGSKFKNKK